METEKTGPKRKRKPSVKPIPADSRVAYTVPEFASLFGRHKNWAYQRVWAGEVKVIRLGEMMVPRSEVERLVSQAAVIG